MAKKVYEESNISAIADSIRAKTGTNTTYKTSEMPDGVNDVYEAGKKAQRVEWWTNYVKALKTVGGGTAFNGAPWNDNTFDPPIDVETISANAMFSNSYIQDLRGILQRNNVNLVFIDSDANYTQFFTVFQGSRVKYLPYLKLPTTSAAYGWFYNCKYLIEVDGYECAERHAFEQSNGANKTFQGCTELVHIIFHGVIANNINLQWSTKLDYESAVSALTCLKNFTGADGAYTKTIYFATSVWDLLASYGKVATNPNTGEACTWEEYIDAKGWIKG